MNIYEFIGQVVVFLIVSFTAIIVIAFIARYFAIVYSLVYVHCYKGIGAKEKYKKLSFWKVRLAFRLMFAFSFICDGMKGITRTNEEYLIDFSSFVPKVAIYGKLK